MSTCAVLVLELVCVWKVESKHLLTCMDCWCVGILVAKA